MFFLIGRRLQDLEIGILERSKEFLHVKWSEAFVSVAISVVIPRVFPQSLSAYRAAREAEVLVFVSSSLAG